MYECVTASEWTPPIIDGDGGGDCQLNGLNVEKTNVSYACKVIGFPVMLWTSHSTDKTVVPLCPSVVSRVGQSNVHYSGGWLGLDTNGHHNLDRSFPQAQAHTLGHT